MRISVSVACIAIAAMLSLVGCSPDNDETVYVPNWEPEDAPVLLLELNDLIAELEDRSTAESPIVIVDQFSGFDAIDDTIDGVHPTDSGENKITTNWAAALTPLLPRDPAEPAGLLLLGDSITDNHYRAALWHSLRSNGYSVDFLGTQHNYPSSVKLDHLSFDGEVFDSDHEGHTGWQTSELLLGSEWDPDGNLATWLDEYPQAPDIVTLHIGTNDLIVGVASPADIVAAITEVVDQLRLANPQVTVLVAQIIPYLPWEDEPGETP